MNTRTLKSLFTLLGLATMLLPYPLRVIGMQSRSASINLEGTEWQGAPITYAVGSALGTFQCNFIFKSAGKAIYKCLAIQLPGVMAGSKLNDPTFVPGTDNPYRPKLVTTPVGSALGEFRGKYTQSGNSIHIEFSDALMNVRIQDDILFGETVYNDTSKSKEKWVMRRLLTTGSVNADSKNDSAALSLSEFQINYFKPKSLTQNIISGISVSDKLLDINYYSFIAGPGELTITFGLTARQASFADQISIQLQDRKTNIVAGNFVTTSRGRSDQAATSITLDEKKALLLRVVVSGGGVSYRVRLDGAIDSAQSQGDHAP